MAIGVALPWYLRLKASNLNLYLYQSSRKMPLFRSISFSLIVPVFFSESCTSISRRFKTNEMKPINRKSREIWTTKSSAFFSLWLVQRGPYDQMKWHLVSKRAKFQRSQEDLHVSTASRPKSCDVALTTFSLIQVAFCCLVSFYIYFVYNKFWY